MFQALVVSDLPNLLQYKGISAPNEVADEEF